MKKLIFSLFLFLTSLNALSFEEAYNIHKTQGAISALSYYKELEKENNVKAIYQLGMIHLMGDGIVKNLNKAYEYFTKASELGDLNSIYLLGKIHLSQSTRFYEPKKAYNFFVEAANKGESKSQLMIGRFFLLGEIVDKDYEKAIYYFKLASKQKEYEANCYIAYMYASGSGVFPNFGRANVFARSEYEKGNKLCVKVWNDYNLGKYKKDDGWKIGDYNEPAK